MTGTVVATPTGLRGGVGRWGGAWGAAAALLLTGGVAALLLLLGGHDPVAALGALLGGAAGSPDRILSATLVRAIPLILTGLAVALAFRAGVFNIGAEGQLYAGAVAGVAVGVLGGNGLPAAIHLPLVMLAAALGGALWALVPALLRIRMGVGEVITTLLMNFVGIYLAAWMVHGPLQEPRGVFPQTSSIAEAARLPVVVPGSRLHAGILLAVGAAVVLHLVLRHTATGFRLRAVGASPQAARVAGRIAADRTVLGAFLTSGALAGLAGGVEVAGVTWALYEGLSPGYGYTAIAVALLAGLHPLGVVAAGIFFGALKGGAGAMQREAGIPAVWVDGMEALVILAVVAVGVLSRRRSS